jgi:SAM-dependent methyltransferase
LIGLSQGLTMNDYQEKTSCRICGSRKIFNYLDLGLSPLANSYVPSENKEEKEFQAPLKVGLCEECGLSQLSCVVNPDLMFKQYLYVSSTPRTFRDHCDGLAETVKKFLKPAADLLALDIASNDGCLLRAFAKHGFRIVGVDPAENLATEANANGVPTICDYWSPEVARQIVTEYGSPSVITGQNVFAHVDDVHRFVQGVSLCLNDDGIFILEFPYVLDFIVRNLFDTIYHEHLSYVGLGPVSRLIGPYGLEVVHVQRFPDIHGGTLRVVSAKRGRYSPTADVAALFKKEEEFGLRRREPYLAFHDRVNANKTALVDLLVKSKTSGRCIWGYGASAKGNTLLNYYGIGNGLIDCIIDDNPKKWDYLTPGTRIPIVGINALKTERERVDDLLLLAWNFGEEIQSRCRAIGYAHDFIYPVPHPYRQTSSLKKE